MSCNLLEVEVSSSHTFGRRLKNVLRVAVTIIIRCKEVKKAARLLLHTSIGLSALKINVLFGENLVVRL